MLKDSDSGNAHLVNCVDEVPERCEVRRVFDEVPHVPIAGASTASMFSGKVQVDILFLGDIIALRTMDM